MRVLSMPLASRLAAIAFVGLLAGCGDDNPIKPPPAIPYPTLNSPQNVLEALVRAYSSRDSVEYRKLFDSAYQGMSEDLRDATSVSFLIGDEVAHIQTLRNTRTITSIDLSLGTESSWARLPSDDLGHPEWAVIQISGSQFHLEINDTFRGLLLVSSSKQFAYLPVQADPSRYRQHRHALDADPVERGCRPLRHRPC